MNNCAPGYDCDLATQIEALGRCLNQNQVITEILDKATSLAMPNWYLGAGCLAQTVWNLVHGFEPTAGIKDYDLVYYDASDTSLEAEARYIEKALRLFTDVDAMVEVKNEARVHLWYEQRFGYEISPYASVEAAINTWPTTATCVGVRREIDGSWTVYAPFGLNDLLGLIVRPNKTQITKDIYETKTDRWLRQWPKLTLVAWD
jgi:hypothetical protein